MTKKFHWALQTIITHLGVSCPESSGIASSQPCPLGGGGGGGGGGGRETPYNFKKIITTINQSFHFVLSATGPT